MNPFALLNPGRWLLYLALGLALLAGGALLKARHDAGQQRIGYDRAQAESAQAMRIQQDRMRELARAAELRYTVARQGQDRFFVTTIKEIAHAAAPLASCPVPADAIRLLNNAARCARGDPGATGCAADPVPRP